MTDLQKTLLQKASGETRLHPDEQRQFLGTFRERVLLALSFDEVARPDVQEQFSTLCHTLSQETSPIFLKLSANLADSLQIILIKTAQEEGITTTITEEKTAASPYALVFHADTALNREDISLMGQFPQLLQRPPKTKPQKNSFWKTLFR